MEPTRWSGGLRRVVVGIEPHRGVFRVVTDRNRSRESSSMPRAVWNGTVLAQSDDTILVEGNHYFPPDSLSGEYLTPSDARSVCPWKGMASYYDVTVDGHVNRGAAWYYPDPKPAAADIRDHVAFWRGVRIEP